jgi:hypothetical protein
MPERFTARWNDTKQTWKHRLLLLYKGGNWMARTQKEPVELSESDRKVSIQATFPGFDSQNMNYLLK